MGAVIPVVTLPSLRETRVCQYGGLNSQPRLWGGSSALYWALLRAPHSISPFTLPMSTPVPNPLNLDLLLKKGTMVLETSPPHLSCVSESHLCPYLRYDPGKTHSSDPLSLSSANSDP